MTEKTPKFREPKWGFWIPVIDHASATYAAKMSGLLVFIAGVTNVLLGLALLTGEVPAAGSVLAIFGLLMATSGIMARNLDFRSLPFTLGIWIVLTLAGSVLMGVSWGLILNAILLLLAVSGLRGWWWLRKNPEQNP